MSDVIVLLSGGLDSATVLAEVCSLRHSVYAMSFAYGQRHGVEIRAARALAQKSSVVEHRIVHIDPAAFAGSALTDSNIAVPQALSSGIPITYVPARNTVFLSYALAWAESLRITDIYIGVNAVDYSGYPDCRPEFIAAFEKLANVATKLAVEGCRLSIRTPLINLSKAEIIARGIALGVDYAVTISCYQANAAGAACGRCDSCRLRANGFEAAGVKDPTVYAKNLS